MPYNLQGLLRPDLALAIWVAQGMEAGLRVLAAAGSVMLGTVQGGGREATRFEPHRDDAGNILDPDALETFLAGVRKLGASRGDLRLLRGICPLLGAPCPDSGGGPAVHSKGSAPHSRGPAPHSGHPALTRQRTPLASIIACIVSSSRTHYNPAATLGPASLCVCSPLPSPGCRLAWELLKEAAVH